MTKSVLLGSASPRRRRLLESAGWTVEQVAPAIDDGVIRLAPSSPARTVEALAWFKSAQILGLAPAHVASVAADTVCVVDGAIVGKPGDRTEAAGMITRMLGRRHRTITGVCVRNRAGRRFFLNDVAEVRMGEIEPDRLEAYLDSGDWAGKAGGYNLEDRIAGGWPIDCDGDPATVMGLPIRRLVPLLEDLAKAEERT